MKEECSYSPWEPTRELPAPFVELAQALYADDPDWIPEDREALKHQFSASHGFFERGSAWVGVVPGGARLAGFHEPNQLVEGKRVAFFGYWETVDDTSINRTLFAKFESWASHNGAKRIYGPINFTTFGNYRLRLNAQPEAGCFIGEPYNPSHYPVHLKALGYDVAIEYVTQSISATAAVARAEERQQVRRVLDTAGLRIESLTADRWLSLMPKLYGAVDSIFGVNFAYRPISEADFKRACGAPFASKLCPHTSVVALDSQDAVAGFFLAFPDYAERVRQGAASPLRPAAVSFEEHAHTLQRQRLLAKTVGVMPAYRGLGLHNLLSFEVITRGGKHYPEGLACLMKGDNFSRRFLDGAEADCRRYGLFAKDLP